MRADTLRLMLIGILLLAAIVSVVANEEHSRVLGGVMFAVFFCAVLLFVRWRRAALEERRGRVFDREAKTDETGPRPDRYQ